MTYLRERSLLQIWSDVISAMFIREIQRRFSDHFGVSWAVLSPLLFIVGFAYLRGVRDGGDTYGISTFMFILFAMLVVSLFLATLTSVSSCIKRNRKLFSYQFVRPIAAVIAVALFELFIISIVGLILVVIVYLLEIEVVMQGPFTIAACFIMSWFLGVAVGLIFAVAEMIVPEVSKLKTFVTRPAFFLSGIFFSLNDIPTEYWYLLDWNPLLHMVELTRHAAYPIYPASGVSLNYAALITLVAVLIGVCTYQLFWRRILSR